MFWTPTISPYASLGTWASPELKSRRIAILYENCPFTCSILTLPRSGVLSGRGELLIFDDCLVDLENPEFGDFSEVIPVSTIGNWSVLCRNGPDTWHGVKPLCCPEGH